MKYYIGTALERASIHNQVRDDLKKLGYNLTYDWTSHGSVKNTSKARLQEVAEGMVQGILNSDFILILLPGGKGTHCEFGISVGCKKKVFLHSEDPMVFELGPQVTAFYHLKEVIQLCCPIDQVAKLLHSQMTAVV
jgi:hypothetical protein